MREQDSETIMILRYVPRRRVPAYQALGWVAHDCLNGTPHGLFSMLCEWPLELGEPVEPEPEE
jgi:hypothetical protein